MHIKRLAISLGVLSALVLSFLFFGAAHPAAAQATVPDMTQFGFPTVGATATYTPGQAVTLTAGNQQVVLPADFISKTVKFELLVGDAATFAPLLKGDDAGRPIAAAFAFRVTDVATGNLVGRFDKPVQYSITDSNITSESEVYNTSPANPPVVTANPAAATIQGTTLSHPFGGAGVGWLVLNAAVQAAPTATAAPVVTLPPPTEGTPVVPVGMPATGNPSPESAALLTLAGFAALALFAGGVALRRRGSLHND